MKKSIVNYVILMITLLANYLSLGQDNPPPGPCNFTETETFCFTNNSNYTLNGHQLAIEGCDYEICVKVKPKIGCQINCELLLNPNGYYIENCFTVSVGQSYCFNIPVFSHPVTDCFEVEITMKVVSQSITLVSNLENDFHNIGLFEQIHDHCLEDNTWYSRLSRTNGNGNYNFEIITIGIIGG